MIIEVILFILLLLLYFARTDRKPPNMPPGPYEIPILGGMPVMNETTAETLRRKYGNIVSTRTGGLRTVIVFDYKTSKEAMARSEFAGRPEFLKEFTIDRLEEGGIAKAKGPQWKHDRRYALRSLRNLGMGKSYYGDAINIEAQALVDDLKKYKGEAIEYPDSFRTAALNILWPMIAGRRYDLRSEELESYCKASNKLQSANMAVMMLPVFFPSLKRLPKAIRNFLFKENIGDAFAASLRENVEKTVSEHEKNFDINDPRDLIDEYLKDMKEAQGDEKSLLRKGALLQIVADFLEAASEPINGMLKWVAYLVANHPHIMGKLQQEIDEAVPRHKLVSFNEKHKLPHVEAFVVESLRFSTFVGLNVLHKAVNDTTLQGYFIPKDTIITTSNYSIHNDPNNWTEPEKFSPDRFIDEDGKFRAPREAFFAFSSGRRLCPGETLARMELFLFTAAIIQNFDVLLPEGEHITGIVNAGLGLRLPAHQKLIYKTRA